MPQVNIRIETVKDEEQQTGAPTQKASDKKEGGAKQSLGTIFTHQLMNTTKMIVMSSINNISNFTGNYQLQESVQNTVEDVMSVVGIGVAFSVNPILGAFSLAIDNFL